MEVLVVLIVCFLLYFFFLRKKEPIKKQVNVKDFEKVDNLIDEKRNHQNKLVTSSEAKHKYYNKIAGVTHNNEDGINRQTILARCSNGEQLFLIREKDNKFNKNAIKICRSNSEQLGYYPDDVQLAKYLDRNKEIYCCISEITGGKKKESIGCNIYIEY